LGGLGRQQIGDLVGQLPGGWITVVLEGGGRGHHIAVDITAGREAGTHGSGHRADDFPQIGLGDAMHLEGLAGGGPQAAVAEPIGQVVEGQVQGRRNATGWTAQPQHHLPVLALPLLAMVPVVLLITAVILQNLDRRVCEMEAVVLQFRGQRFLEMAALGFQRLDLGGLAMICRLC